jgi:hypothetical protein
MTVASQTEFLIEGLQPSWLPTKRQRVLYRLESGFIGGLIIGQINGLIFEMINASGYGWGGGLSIELIYMLIYLLINALINAFGYGLAGGLIYGLWIGFQGDIKPVETLKWSWKEVKIGMRNGLIGGLICGLLGGLISASAGGLIYAVIMGPVTGLVTGLICMLIGGLICGFRGSPIQQKEKPNYGILRSIRNAIIIGILIFVIFGLIGGVINGLIHGLFGGLSFGLSFGLLGMVGGLILGGNAAIRHFVLRFMLYRRRYAPWNYTHFLDYATDRLFMQKVGGGYIFVHRMLLEHFAEMSIEQEKR